MLLQPGVSEISLSGELKAGLEVRAGGRLPVLADLVAGVRTGEMGGLPGPYVLQEGDPVIADIGAAAGWLLGGHLRHVLRRRAAG